MATMPAQSASKQTDEQTDGGDNMLLTVRELAERDTGLGTAPNTEKANFVWEVACENLDTTVVEFINELGEYVSGSYARKILKQLPPEAFDLSESADAADANADTELATDGGSENADYRTDDYGRMYPAELDGIDIPEQTECPACESDDGWTEQPAGYYHCLSCMTVWAGDPGDAHIIDYCGPAIETDTELVTDGGFFRGVRGVRRHVAVAGHSPDCPADDADGDVETDTEPATDGGVECEDGAQQDEKGAFIEVDEDDPFVAVQLRVMAEDGSGFVAGGLEVEPGRYELRKVDDEEKLVTDGGSPRCDYCGGTDLAYEMRSDRGDVCRCIPCLAIERGQAQFSMPFESFIDRDVDGIVFEDEDEWYEHREISYTTARDWYRVLARIVQDDPLVKRDPDAIGTLSDHTRTSLTNIMGEDAHYPPSEVAGNPVSPGQMTFDTEVSE